MGGAPPLDLADNPEGSATVPADVGGAIVGVAQDNPRWGYRRIQGELAYLGYRVSASSIRGVLAAHGMAAIHRAARRATTTWRAFIRARLGARWPVTSSAPTPCWGTACRCCSSLRSGLGGCGLPESLPTRPGAWVTQPAGNVVAAMQERGDVPRHLVRDRDTKFSRAFDDVWRSIGAQIIPTPVPTPVANAYAERWIGSVRRDCLDRLLLADRHHLERVLKLYVGHTTCTDLTAVLVSSHPRPAPFLTSPAS